MYRNRKFGGPPPTFWGGGAGTPSNTKSPGLRPTSIASGILMRPMFGHNRNGPKIGERGAGREQESTMSAVSEFQTAGAEQRKARSEGKMKDVRPVTKRLPPKRFLP